MSVSKLVLLVGGWTLLLAVGCSGENGSGTDAGTTDVDGDADTDTDSDSDTDTTRPQGRTFACTVCLE